MGKACEAFGMQDAAEAKKHMEYRILTDYGDCANGRRLHTWDEGRRMLAVCKNCGGYILIQESEYHGVESDGYYVDWFPVSSSEEAEMLNRRYDGFAIETEFPARYLCMTNLRVHWSNK